MCASICVYVKIDECILALHPQFSIQHKNKIFFGNGYNSNFIAADFISFEIGFDHIFNLYFVYLSYLVYVIPWKVKIFRFQWNTQYEL